MREIRMLKVSFLILSKLTAWVLDIELYLTALWQARQFIHYGTQLMPSVVSLPKNW